MLELLKDKYSEVYEPRICLFTQRAFHKKVARCINYEFEDIIGEIDNVDVLMPIAFWWFPGMEKVANQIGKKVSKGYLPLNPGLKPVKIRKDYDLFFATAMFPRDLMALNAIKGWRQRCRTAVCFLHEIWAGEMHDYKDKMKILRKFDYVLTICLGSVQAIQDAIERPCYYVAPGIDAVKFCPYPEPPVRSIDVVSLGRRSPYTHQALLEMTRQNKIFYFYDSIHSGDMYPQNSSEHRSMLANILKRSRYLLVNTAKIDRSFETHGQEEIGARFVEGAASGAVMIGEVPQNRVFDEQFDWPNAVIPLPFDAVNIDEIMDDLDSQPHLIEEIRINSVIKTLERNDWAYRWEKVLELAGLEPTPELEARKNKLKKLAKMIKANQNPISGNIANTR
jgi:hypothetical protein